MIERDRALLARAATVNRSFGAVVVELMQRHDDGQLPAGPLREVGELLAGLGREFIDRAAEIDGGARTIDAAEHVMLLNGQADQAM